MRSIEEAKNIEKEKRRRKKLKKYKIIKVTPKLKRMRKFFWAVLYTVFFRKEIKK